MSDPGNSDIFFLITYCYDHVILLMIGTVSLTLVEVMVNRKSILLK